VVTQADFRGRAGTERLERSLAARSARLERAVETALAIGCSVAAIHLLRVAATTRAGMYSG
jgi:hypothetical protein